MTEFSIVILYILAAVIEFQLLNKFVLKHHTHWVLQEKLYLCTLSLQVIEKFRSFAGSEKYNNVFPLGRLCLVLEKPCSRRFCQVNLTGHALPSHCHQRERTFGSSSVFSPLPSHAPGFLFLQHLLLSFLIVCLPVLPALLKQNAGFFLNSLHLNWFFA